MKFKMNLKRSLGVSSGLALAIMAAELSAAPGVISKQPLFIGASTQPNIMFLIDDSGSMGWSYVYNKRDNGNTVGSVSSGSELYRCAGYNLMAFDINKAIAGQYTPWLGLDGKNGGNPYVDRTLDSVSASNDTPFSGNFSTDISNTYYIDWNDSDSDGNYDGGECVTGTANRRYARDLATAELKVQYANWHTYYRHRELVAKRALSEIITDSTARMGLATLHDNNDVGTQVKEMDTQSTSPEQVQNQANKNALLRQLFRVRSSGGTPLRQRLNDVGKYFDQSQNPPWSLFNTTNPPSPILPKSENGECQQNFAILMSDGFWNGGSPGVGNTDVNSTTSEFDGGDYADGFSNTLADVAMHYYERDLATGLPNNVKTIPGVDENEAQHMVTYTVAFGVNGQRNNMPPDWTDAEKAAGWPQPTRNTSSTIDDVRHAAFNGRGDYLSARDPQVLIDSLAASIRSINNRQGSASAVAFSSTSLSTETNIFQGLFDSRGWYGDLVSFELGENGIVGTNWHAGEILENRNLSTNKRKVVTYNGKRGVKFKFPDNYWQYFPNADLTNNTINLNNNVLSAMQMQDLLKDAPRAFLSTDSDHRIENRDFAKNVVSYILGDHSNEGAGALNFRDRFGHRLGDIVNSSPKFVGAPSNSYPENLGSTGKPYSDFVNSKKNRKGMVYVGANDGMLHGFVESNGKEQFAYIPGLAFSNQAGAGLHFLADKQYTHTPYVDGSPAIQDVFIDSNWRTYLVGSMRAGARGIFVLDVTSPNDNTMNKAKSWVKFEFSHPDLGHTFSDPQIVKLNNGKWAAVIGNGYNADPLGDGKAKLFLVYLDGSGVRILDTGVGTAVTGTEVCPPGVSSGSSGCIVPTSCSDVGSDCNGLSTPLTLDITGDYVVDRVYAGDLHGNIWAFDVSDPIDTKWGVAHGDGSTVTPLFTACSSAVNTDTSSCPLASRQPITAKPSVKGHAGKRLKNHAPSLLVYFGSGQFLANGDASTETDQAVYGVWDSGIGGLNRDNLTEQVITAVTRGRILTELIPEFKQTSKDGMGWYMNLPDDRERSVTTPVLFGSLLLFNTIVPDAASCDGGGYGYFMAVDALTGGQPKFQVLDLDGDGVLDDGSGKRLNSMGGEISIIGKKAVFNQSDATLNILEITDVKDTGKRTSWTILR